MPKEKAIIANQAKPAPYTKEQVELITRTVAKGATTDELKLFLVVANKTKLDPFTKQIHFVKRRQRQKDGSYLDVGAIQVGIDGLRAIAERSGEYAGSDDIVYDKEGAPHPEKATATIYRIVKNVRVPYSFTARWKEYVPPTPMDFMWKKMPYLMLGKVAESGALRKAFPNDLSGLYVEEEMEQVGTVVTNPDEVTVASKPQISNPSLPLPEPVANKEAEPTNIFDRLFQVAREYGAKEGMEAVFIQENLGINIEWSLLSPTDINRIITQLMSLNTKR